MRLSKVVGRAEIPLRETMCAPMDLRNSESMILANSEIQYSRLEVLRGLLDLKLFGNLEHLREEQRGQKLQPKRQLRQEGV